MLTDPNEAIDASTIHKHLAKATDEPTHLAFLKLCAITNACAWHLYSITKDTNASAIVEMSKLVLEEASMIENHEPFIVTNNEERT